MIWNEDISFEGFHKKIDDWYRDKDFEISDPPIDAQYALNLIFKTLVDDKEHYSYLTSMPELIQQTNSIYGVILDCMAWINWSMCCFFLRSRK